MVSKRKLTGPTKGGSSKRPRIQDENHPGRIVMDPVGDVILKVDDFEDEDGNTRNEFLASSKALSLSSKVFDRMFNGHFAEAVAPEFGLREVPLEDNQSALMFILDIVHMRFDRVQKQLDVHELWWIAQVSDKYDLVEVVRPFVKDPIKPIRQAIRDMKSDYDEYPYFLFTAWVFGYVEEYKTIFERIVWHSRLIDDEEGECYEGSSVHGSNLYVTGKSRETLSITPHMPPRANDAIVKARKEIFEDFDEVCHRYEDNLVAEVLFREWVPPNQRQNKCIRAEIGALTLCLNDNGHHSGWKRTRGAKNVLNQLMDHGENVRRHCPAEDNCCTSSWSVGVFNTSLKEIKGHEGGLLHNISIGVETRHLRLLQDGDN